MRRAFISLTGLLLLLLPLTVLADASITVSPSEGPPGTRMQITGTGFDPGGIYTLQVVDSNGTRVYEETYVARPDGALSEPIESERTDPPGQYTLRIVTAQGVPVASATTRLTAPMPAGGTAQTGAPGMLPRTGDPGSIAPLLAGLGAALVGVGYARRRRAGTLHRAGRRQLPRGGVLPDERGAVLAAERGGCRLRA